MTQNVVVTSLAVASSIGNNTSDFSNNLFKNTNGISKISGNRVPEDFIVKYGSILKNVYNEKLHHNSFTDAKCLINLLLAELLTNNSLEKIDGLILGSNDSSSDWNSTIHALKSKSNQYFTATNELDYIKTKLIDFGLNEIKDSFSIYNTCVTGNSAIGMAFQRIKNGMWKNAVVGVIEQRITPWNLMPLVLLGVINTTANDETFASCPFNNKRSGFIKGEGGAFFILESEESALKRNAQIHARVLGYSLTSDAYQMTEGRKDLHSSSHAINLAINEAKLSLGDIGYINAHGTSTIYNDKLEVDLIKHVFGKLVKNIPMSSTKSQIGHLNIACGAVEAIATILMLKNQKIAPTLNIKNDSIDSEIDFVPDRSRDHQFNYAISNSFGFGGLNSCLVLGKY